MINFPGIRFLRLFLIFFLLSSVISAQGLTPEHIAGIKEAVVYVKVKHRFLPSDEEITTTGSGFFISSDGFLVTNYHVIQNVVSVYNVIFPTFIENIKIVCKSGTPAYKTYSATIYSVDKENDLAILSIRDTTQFSYLKTDSAEGLVETAPVWVFGYPFGESFAVIQRGPEVTVTQGNISALRHDDKNILNSVQIDASVNPGNSGGPLVNAKGEVIGIVNRSGKDTRMNFAVPSHYLQKLLVNSPLKKNNDSLQVMISTDPPGAAVFVNGKNIGISPLNNVRLNPGWQTVCAVKDGYSTCVRQYTVQDGKPLALSLSKQKKHRVFVPDKPEEKTAGMPADAGTIYRMKGELLLKEDFTNNAVFDQWKQNTGGLEQRTWFLEDGMLQQHDDDGALHAISLGDSMWSDYRIKVRMKIGGKEGDPRAGIIFRETQDGFYLFRIHRESNKAQLAYHCKAPFGWNVIREKELSKDVTEKWYDVSVSASGNRITCFLDSVTVFDEAASYSSAGRIGFYSVESKPAFKGLVVEKINGVSQLPQDNTQGLTSFWFSDNFDTRSDWWYQYVSDAGTPSPWMFSDGGVAQMMDDDKQRYSEFTRYVLDDFTMIFSLTFNKGNDTSMFEVFFRKTGSDYLALQFLSKGNKVRIVQVKNGESKVLKSESLPNDFFSKYHNLRLVVKEGKIICGTAMFKLIAYKGKISTDAGSFGFSSKALKFVLHDMNVASVREEDLK